MKIKTRNGWKEWHRNGILNTMRWAYKNSLCFNSSVLNVSWYIHIYIYIEHTPFYERTIDCVVCAIAWILNLLNTKCTPIVQYVIHIAAVYSLCIACYWLCIVCKWNENRSVGQITNIHGIYQKKWMASNTRKGSMVDGLC